MHELSNSEIAAVLHKEIGAVKSLQHRALAALRRELEQREKVVA
jgi:DNA-directed RNA polymerase specialized sigma24 family protein